MQFPPSIGLKLVDLNCSSFQLLVALPICILKILVVSAILVVSPHLWKHDYVIPNGQTVPKPQWLANSCLSCGQIARVISPNWLLLLHFGNLN